MSKFLPILALALALVGCEAVNDQKPSKPFGISKYNNEGPKGDHFMKDMLAKPEAKPTATPAATSAPATTPASASTPAPAVASSPSVTTATDDASVQMLRQRYGIPDTSVIKDEDVNAMIRFYTKECLRLQERQK